MTKKINHDFHTICELKILQMFHQVRADKELFILNLTLLSFFNELYNFFFKNFLVWKTTGDPEEI